MHTYPVWVQFHSVQVCLRCSRWRTANPTSFEPTGLGFKTHILPLCLQKYPLGWIVYWPAAFKNHWYVCEVSSCQPDWTVRQQWWWQMCVCVWVCVSESLSAAPEWMVRIRDSHAKGQSGRKRQQSCLKRALFLITTSNVPLCTSFPPRPPGISESSMMMMRTMMMIMMSPDGQTPPASPTSLYSSQTLNRNLTEKLCTFFFVTIKSFIINKF